MHSMAPKPANQGLKGLIQEGESQKHVVRQVRIPAAGVVKLNRKASIKAIMRLRYSEQLPQKHGRSEGRLLNSNECDRG
eukprot:4266141-Pleurochrysis_carterae.AAC.2